MRKLRTRGEQLQQCAPMQSGRLGPCREAAWAGAVRPPGPVQGGGVGQRSQATWARAATQARAQHGSTVGSMLCCPGLEILDS